MSDPYGRDVLDASTRMAKAFPLVTATVGLRVEHRATRLRGTVVRWEKDGLWIRGEVGAERLFRWSPGAFTIDAKTVTLVAPTVARPPAKGLQRTASGSVAVPAAPARVAAASRILVEGIHDAALVERVWGDDLRIEGVVVERLDGIDVLPDVVRTFRPGPGRRLGVLVDHLVPGSKESRLAAAVAGPHVLVTGIPFVDIWQAVKPAAVGIAAWPTIPIGTDWKTGICGALGVADPQTMWRRVLASVSTWTDVEPPLVNAVERLIDFVCDPAGA